MQEPIVNNAADEKQVGEAGKKIAVSKNSEKNELIALLSLKSFRKFMYQYVSRCDGHQCAKDSGSWTYHALGELNVFRKLKSQLVEADPEAVHLMMKEGSVDFK